MADQTDTARADPLARIAGALLLVTACTQFMQLWFVPVDAAVIAAAAFAVPYAAFGGALITLPTRTVGILSIVLTAIGLVLGLIRFFAIEATFFGILNPILDVVIIVLLIVWLVMARSDD